MDTYREGMTPGQELGAFVLNHWGFTQENLNETIKTANDEEKLELLHRYALLIAMMRHQVVHVLEFIALDVMLQRITNIIERAKGGPYYGSTVLSYYDREELHNVVRKAWMKTTPGSSEEVKEFLGCHMTLNFDHVPQMHMMDLHDPDNVGAICIFWIGLKTTEAIDGYLDDRDSSILAAIRHKVGGSPLELASNPALKGN